MRWIRTLTRGGMALGARACLGLAGLLMSAGAWLLAAARRRR